VKANCCRAEMSPDGVTFTVTLRYILPRRATYSRDAIAFSVHQFRTVFVRWP